MAEIMFWYRILSPLHFQRHIMANGRFAKYCLGLSQILLTLLRSKDGLHYMQHVSMDMQVCFFDWFVAWFYSQTRLAFLIWRNSHKRLTTFVCFSGTGLSSKISVSKRLSTSREGSKFSTGILSAIRYQSKGCKWTNSPLPSVLCRKFEDCRVTFEL